MTNNNNLIKGVSNINFSSISLSFISFIALFAVILLIPIPVKSAAIVKGEMPTVEPLQSLPTSIKPDYNNSVQSGEFESSPIEEVEAVPVEQAPVAAPIVKSGNSYVFVLLFIAVLILGVGIYFLWKKIKLKL